MSKTSYKESPFLQAIPTKGRPKLLISPEGLKTIKQLASIQCTDEEIASVMSCSVDLLTNKNNKEAFYQAKADGARSGRASLRRMQWKTAEGGNSTMQIWLGKQYLNQKDKQDVVVDTEQDFVFNIMPASEFTGTSDAE